MAVIFNGEKFRELMLYLADRSMGDPRFGKTKLAKLLFYSDFSAYLSLGEPVTGAEYARYPRGPLPRAMNAEIRALEDQAEAVLARTTYHTQEQIRLVPLRRPNLNVFTAAEIALVDEVLDTLRDHDAAAVSDLSHLEVGWRITPEYETIPYETAFISGEPLDPGTMMRGKELAAELNLLTSA